MWYSKFMSRKPINRWVSILNQKHSARKNNYDYKIIEGINISKLQLLKFNYSVLCLFCSISLFIPEILGIVFVLCSLVCMSLRNNSHASKKTRNKLSKFPAGEDVILDSWKNINNHTKFRFRRYKTQSFERSLE